MKKLIYIAAAIMLLTSIFPTMNYSAQARQTPPVEGIEIILKNPEASLQQLEQMADIISVRLEHFGVEQYEMNILGEAPRLSVRLADEQLAKQVLPLITATGNLEFCEAYTAAEFQSMAVSEEWKKWISSPGDGSAAILGYLDRQQITLFMQFAQEQYEHGQLPDELRLALSHKANEESKRSIYALRYGSDFTAVLDNKAVTTLDVVGPEGGSASISLQFTGTAAKHWAQATKDNIDRPIAIVIDGLVYSAPVVKEEITSGKVMITGDFEKGEVMLLAALLSADPLPLPFQQVEVRQ